MTIETQADRRRDDGTTWIHTNKIRVVGHALDSGDKWQKKEATA